MRTGRPHRIEFRRRADGGRWLHLPERSVDLDRIDEVTWEHQLRCTQIAGIGPLEHLGVATLLLGVAGWEVILEHEDMPLLDGSALPWVEAIRATGPASGHPRRLSFSHGGFWENSRGWVRFTPGSQLEVEVHWADGPEGPECWRGGADDLTGILPARTFARFEEWWKARQAGMLEGTGRETGRLFRPRQDLDAAEHWAKLQGIDVLGAVWVGGAPRLDAECAAHKALDLLGDLGILLGGIPWGKIEARDAGHGLHHAMARGLRTGNVGKASFSDGEHPATQPSD